MTPKPPEGYRLLTDEEKKLPLPGDAIALLGKEWLPSRVAGRLAAKSDQRETFYATRSPSPTDSEMLDWLAEELKKWRTGMLKACRTPPHQSGWEYLVEIDGGYRRATSLRAAIAAAMTPPKEER